MILWMCFSRSPRRSAGASQTKMLSAEVRLDVSLIGAILLAFRIASRETASGLCSSDLFFQRIGAQRCRGRKPWRSANGATTSISMSLRARHPMGARWRTGRDSNPRTAINRYTLSRRAPSTTRPPVRKPPRGPGIYRLGPRGQGVWARGREGVPSKAKRANLAVRPSLNFSDRPAFSPCRRGRGLGRVQDFGRNGDRRMVSWISSPSLPECAAASSSSVRSLLSSASFFLSARRT
jgi:hypothetical protein